MSEVKHTPGPWSVDFEETTKIKAPDGTLATVTHIHLRGRRKPYEVAANAHLIAAAPDLLEAVRDALSAWENHQKHGDQMDGHWASDARAAIAKAEGRA